MSKHRRRGTSARRTQRHARQGRHSAQAQPQPRFRRHVIVAGAALLLACAALVGAYLLTRSSGPTLIAAGPPTSGPPGPTPLAKAPPTYARRIDGIPCNDENVNYHVHDYLQIVDEGRNVTIPANIGIVDNMCVYYVHTHDNSGEIHVEAPRYQHLTLGNLFDIWGKRLSRQQVGDITVPAGKELRVYLNLKPYSGDPRSIELLAHRLIALEIGPPFVEPSTFDWQGD